MVNIIKYIKNKLYFSFLKKRGEDPHLPADPKTILPSPTLINFSCFGKGISESDAREAISKMREGDYIEEIRDRLSEIGINLEVKLNNSQIYEEALSGLRHRIVFYGYSSNLNFDKEEVQNIFQDLLDDFSEIGLEIRWRD